MRGIGAKTAAVLLDGGLPLEDLPASGRLAGRKGAAVTSAWQQQRGHVPARVTGA